MHRSFAPIIALFVGIVVAIAIGNSIGTGDVSVAAGAIAVLLLALVWFSTREIQWAILVASVFLPGNLPFIPLQFRPYELIAALVFARFVVDQVIIGKTRLSIGPPVFFALIIAIFSILFIHGAQMRFGLRALGSSYWGGREYLSLLLTLGIYIAAHSQGLTAKSLRFLPWILIIFALFNLGVDVTSRFGGTLGYFLGQFYSGFLPTIDSGEASGRIGAFGQLGYTMAIVVLSSMNLARPLVAKNFLLGILLMIAAILSAVSGFRSVILNFASAVLGASIRDLRWKTIFLAVLGTLALLLLPFVHSNLQRLPTYVQRAIIFLPGEWDSDVYAQGQDSIEWRQILWKTWAATQYPGQELFGRGIGFSSLEFESRMKGEAYKIEVSAREAEVQRYILVQELHNGFLSTIDMVGIIGTCLFGLLCILVIKQIFTVLNPKSPLRNSIGAQSLGLMIFMFIFGFWYGAERFDRFLVDLMAMFGVLSSVIISTNRSRHSELDTTLNNPLHLNRA
jgi:hypothetical protein